MSDDQPKLPDVAMVLDKMDRADRLAWLKQLMYDLMDWRQQTDEEQLY